MKRLILIVLALLASGCAAYPPARVETDADVYYKRGEAWSIKGDYDRAIANYDKAIEINPIFVAAYNNRGNAYSKKGQHDQAISDYTKAIEISPRLVDAYSNRGFVYLVKLRNKDKGCADWKTACELGRCRNYKLAKQKGFCP